MKKKTFCNQTSWNMATANGKRRELSFFLPKIARSSLSDFFVEIVIPLNFL